jgi:hypothetical protein
MALTLAALKNQISHVLGGSPSSKIGDITIINEAGRHLFHYQWKFRERAPKSIFTNIDVDHVVLPDDVGEVTRLRMKDGLTDSIRLTTIEEVVDVRNTTISTGNNYVAAIVWPVAYGTAGQEQHPRLELAPTPTTVEELTLVYKAKFEEFQESDTDETVAKVPSMAEGVFTALVRAIALGYEEENMTQRLMEVEASPVFQRLLVSDGFLQPDYGPLRNGAVGGINQYARVPFSELPGPGYTPPNGI